ncbi:RHS repeat-associated core domain-containing protein [uncultured Pseudoteredinibacter sp.]|uniref:RHS repeat-associated core domain-containing protein n=1 Tax=uncultured Pseudoteredinibacter sp. TaxID=1641701 RepID=UPI0026118891|nr:RHS repeat-associated core domain-containing protein [uncultured Pseudoteredinibacter sp.]
MNGRGYDYNLGRFLSVDPFIVDPGNTQAINPYSYVLNNPLSGTDPTGYRTRAIDYGNSPGNVKDFAKDNHFKEIKGQTEDGKIVVKTNGGSEVAVDRKIIENGFSNGGTSNIGSNANRANTENPEDNDSGSGLVELGVAGVLIVGGHYYGLPTATAMLKNYLSEDPEDPYEFDSEWLRNHPEVIQAEIHNIDLIDKRVEKTGESLGKGESTRLSVYANASITPADDDFYYASGTSTLTSTANIRVAKDAQGRISATGQISHTWRDRYDWHDDLGAKLPRGNLIVSDKTMNKLKNSGRGKEFEMRSWWVDQYEY